MAALIEDWHTEGEVVAQDGRTVIAAVEGSDAHEPLGPSIVHHVDVVIGGERTRALEIFEPLRHHARRFPAQGL